MGSINDCLTDITGFDIEILIIIFGIALFYFRFLSKQHPIIDNVIITAFILALYDLLLKKILLFSIVDDYYKLIINNIISIITIYFMFNIIKYGSNSKYDLMYYFDLGFSCLFYETIIFKLYNYNNLCNDYLRSLTKTILRLSTIHILTNFLAGYDYDYEWFDISFSHIVNAALFDVVFND